MITSQTDGDPDPDPSLPLPNDDGVCGSLDPPSPSQKSSKPGWRYFQCTNIRDELRVLLPPRPAAIYANLLKVEACALAKNDADSLREVQHIRYLKEAMVKRCRKLTQDAIGHRSIQNISVVEAPLDFKLKRLEQWWTSIEARRKTQNCSKSSQEREERSSIMQASMSAVTTSSSSDSEYSAKLSLSSAGHGSSEQRGRSPRQWRPKGKLTKLQTISAVTNNSIKKNLLSRFLYNLPKQQYLRTTTVVGKALVKRR
ncbi:uncharacterized protein FOMMEDRAFT_22554 [Fomitiporia mediterranea MF3/22]|uniref:uncharacterized protein n=1 Tax=Fomitiporia mediterranea (strain MF3/22) TaxID=694068 RepID=UPI0004408E48|nr:uncharacterized protein FOMMEDRAFT_22554 [Fomitiporia mediterranea MF3/22]EJD00126.1 hypothetical protein FOMMEDRAFT_22554 [Fomitiporia mediterranea MF3/22]